MNRVEMGIGTTQVLQGGIEISTKPLINIEVSKNPDIVDMSEAGHVVLNPLNISYVVSNADNGRTGIINFDAVQAAAHTHGNSHDRHITEARGINYDQMAGIAASELSAQKGKQFYFAGYLNMNKGREISRAEAISVLEGYEQKDDVEVTVWVNGQEVSTVTQGDGEHVIVDLDSISKQNHLDIDEVNEDKIKKTETFGITDSRVDKDSEAIEEIPVEPQPETMKNIEEFLKAELMKRELEILTKK